MYFSLTGSRDRGQNAARRWRPEVLALLAGLLVTSPAFSYAISDGIEQSVILPANISAIRLAQAQPAAPTPAAPAPNAAASAQQGTPDEPIGNVATLTGTASVTRNNQSAVPLKLKDDIYLNDVVQTSANSTLGVTFNDETTFNLNASASLTIDDFVYEDGRRKNSALFDITKGTVAFVAAAVAKTGNMKITTPTATLGIRGTTGLVEVNGAGGGAHNIKLYPDPDGHVGTIDVNDRAGARLGSLTQGSSGFTLRPGAGGRITAAALVISPQQAARDQGFVRQVHAAQAVGRRVVTEQRALRRANPTRNNLRNAPGQPGQRQNNRQQRENNLQQRGPQQQNPAGQQGQPGEPGRATQQGQQQPANAARQGGAPNRPAAPPRRPAPPKKPKENR